MFEYAQPLHDLIEELRHIPGIGAKTAQRIAFYFLGLPTADADRLAEAIREAKRKIFYCARCNNITHVDPCLICSDEHRSDESLSIVEEPFNISSIERTGAYNGRYHVLLGALSPLKGRGPDELRLGKLDAEPQSGEEMSGLPIYDNVGLGSVAGVYEIDTFDNHNVPHRGTRLTARWHSSLEALGADDEYDKVSLLYTTARTFRDRHTLLLGLSGGVSPDENVPYYDQFMLGGLFKMSGLADKQLLGQNMAFGELLYYLRLGKSLYVGCGVETGNTWDNRDEAAFGDLLWGGDVFAVYDSILGPIYAVYAYTEGEDSGRFRFALGKNF